MVMQLLCCIAACGITGYTRERKENTTPLGDSIKSSLKCNQATLGYTCAAGVAFVCTHLGQPNDSESESCSTWKSGRSFADTCHLEGAPQEEEGEAVRLLSGLLQVGTCIAPVCTALYYTALHCTALQGLVM